jgi:hypothetical protein
MRQNVTVQGSLDLLKDRANGGENQRTIDGKEQSDVLNLHAVDATNGLIKVGRKYTYQSRGKHIYELPSSP